MYGEMIASGKVNKKMSKALPKNVFLSINIISLWKRELQFTM